MNDSRLTCTWPGGDTRRVRSHGWVPVVGNFLVRITWTEQMDELSVLLGEKPASSMKREAWVPAHWLT